MSTDTSSPQEHPKNTPHTADPRIQRQMAGCILFAFESAIARLVLEDPALPSTLPPNITKGLSKNPCFRFADVSTLSATDLIHGAYLSQLFDICDAILQSERATHTNQLREWCTTNSIYDLRNALSHPARPFAEHMWYQLQALATHPAVLQLGLREIVDAHRACLANQFTPPPDAWVQAIASSEIPNNLLTAAIEHPEGSFVGRKAALQTLRQRLLTPTIRAVAIVGEGGLGKTAFAIECLRTLRIDLEAHRVIDRIVMLTARNVRLTPDGQQPMTPAFTDTSSLLTALARELLDDDEATGDDALSAFAEVRLLLCLDNLETVLLTNPDFFPDLFSQLPATWKVLVTSRVPVDLTWTQRLERLPEGEAIQITRQHAAMTGVLTSIAPPMLLAIATNAESPLAIKLCIDCIALGASPEHAIDTARRLTVDFAFQNLVDHLPPDSRWLLEAVFAVGGSIAQHRLGLLLDWELNRLQSAISQLMRANVLTPRQTEQDQVLELSSALQEFVRLHPLDLAFRETVFTRWHTHLTAADNAKLPGAKSRPETRFADVTDADLIRQLKSSLALARVGRAPEGLAQLRRLRQFFPRVSAVLRAEAGILDLIRDFPGRLRALEEAIRCDGSDVRARLELAEVHRDLDRYGEALRYTQPLIDSGMLMRDEVDPRVRRRLATVHYKNCLWLGSDLVLNGDEVIGSRYLEQCLVDTQSWDSAPEEIRPFLGFVRASAIRRLTEVRGSPWVERLRQLNNALSVLTGLYDERGVLDFTVPELRELFAQFEWTSRCRDAEVVRGEWTDVFAAISKYALAARALERNPSAEIEWKSNLTSLRAFGLRYGLVGGNEPDWSLLGKVPDAEELAQFGYVSAIVTNPSNHYRGYLFAKEIGGEVVFVHHSAASVTRSDFEHIPLGTMLMVLTGPSPRAGLDRKAIDVYVV